MGAHGKRKCGTKQNADRSRMSANTPPQALYGSITPLETDPYLYKRSVNYIPFPSSNTPLTSPANLLKYKKNFTKIWKNYYNMGSRRQEEENKKEYNRYEKKVFRHILIDFVKEEVPESKEKLENLEYLYMESINNLNKEYNNSIKFLNKKYNSMYSIAGEQSTYNILYGGLAATKEELNTEKTADIMVIEEQYANMMQTYKDEYYRAQENLLEDTWNMIQGNSYLLERFQRKKYNYMRNVVEGKTARHGGSRRTNKKNKKKKKTKRKQK